MSKNKKSLSDLSLLFSGEVLNEETEQPKENLFPQVGDEGWAVVNRGWEYKSSVPEGIDKDRVTFQHDWKVVKAGIYKSAGYDNNLNKLFIWSLLGHFSQVVQAFPTKEEAEAFLASADLPTKEELCSRISSESNHIRGHMGRDSDW